MARFSPCQCLLAVGGASGLWLTIPPQNLMLSNSSMLEVFLMERQCGRIHALRFFLTIWLTKMGLASTRSPIPGFIFGHLARDPHSDNNVTRRHIYSWGKRADFARGGVNFYRYVFEEVGPLPLWLFLLKKLSLKVKRSFFSRK